MTDAIAELKHRVGWLEYEVAMLKATVWPAPPQPMATPDPQRPRAHDMMSPAQPVTLPPPTSSQPSTPTTVPSANPMGAPRSGSVAPPRGGSAEDELIGTWFPRVGALALVIGTGFGFKYAIDQGWIGPALRVLAGLMLGLGLLGLSEWSRKRDWAPYAAAVAGGGIAVLYLTLWVSMRLYGFLVPAEAFAALLFVSAAGGGFALRHSSQALAVMALVGGFINPFVTGVGSQMPVGLYLYTLALDATVIGLSLVRRWTPLEKVAFFGSWVLFAAGEGSRSVSFMAATVLFGMFLALPYLRSLRNRGNSWSDAGFIVTNGYIYYAAIFATLSDDLEVWRGTFTLALAALYAGLAVLMRTSEGEGVLIRNLSGAMAVFFVVVWAPVELDGQQVMLMWALQGAAFMIAAGVTGWHTLRAAGWTVTLLAVVAQIGMRGLDPFVTVDDTIEFAVFVLTVGTLSLAAYLESKERSLQQIDVGVAAVVAANLVALIGLSLELFDAVGGRMGSDEADVQFGLSAMWALYAAGLLTVGIMLRSKTARTMSIVLFGITLSKMALNDLWLLNTLQRLIGFFGIGALLLTASLSYNRAKNFILEGLER
ncbi:MAG TPA: DUF2339 domain-containing protein [Actinomycetota bacterium]|nr:DUF2339 domain-containing protein [Actinomycetota bacterium]